MYRLPLFLTVSHTKDKNTEHNQEREVHIEAALFLLLQQQ
jgi:hypothetical protein